MTDTDQTLRDVIARLDALEQRNAVLEQQNVTLVAEVHTLHSAMTTALPVPTEPARHAAALDRMSRRWVLRRAAQATAATVTAGMLMQRTTQPASADHSAAIVKADQVEAHFVRSENQLQGIGVLGITTSDGNPGVLGHNFGSGPGVQGSSASGGTGVIGVGSNGVQGESPNPDASGVYGFNTGNGFGVAGDTTSSAATVSDLAYARAGVFGRNNGTGAGVLGLSVKGDGDGVWGNGKVGVRGTSVNGHGLFGDGGSGYGGQFKGTRAQLRLTPTGRIGKPTTGSHQIGELYLDQVGSLFICTAAGTPGTWKKVTVS